VGKWGAAWPNEPQYAAAWSDFRRQQVTELLAAFCIGMKRIRPGISISVAINPNELEAAKSQFQDWPTWSRDGLVDVLCPRVFASETAQAETQTKSIVDRSAGRQVWSGLAAWQLTPEQLVNQVKAVRRAGAAGFALATYGDITKEVADERYLRELHSRLALVQAAADGPKPAVPVAGGKAS
jgi:uncharacterized lipoprotein YddW (UPF0748 family)